MFLNKYSNSIILKELSLRNFEDQKILFLNFPRFLELKIFFPINNFNIFKVFGLSSLIYSYFFCSFFFDTFSLKLSFSKKVFIKRRKKKIKRQLNGFYFSFSNNLLNLNFFFERLLYNYSNIFLSSILYKNGHNKYIKSNYVNISLDTSFIFLNHYNSLLNIYKLSNNFFLSFFSNSFFSSIILLFFLRSLSFNFKFNKLNLNK